MTHDQVRRNAIRGAMAGYVRLGLRMVLGLVTFRLLYQHLEPEAFGYWSLLWSLFGYGIVLDFGFGFAAQKRVAELGMRKDWQALSAVLSTILVAYVASAVVITLAGLVLAGPLVDLFGVSPANRESFRTILQIFLAGVGLAFPLGLFPEVLQGQQRIATAYNINTLALLANFVAVTAAVAFHFSLATLVVLTLLAVLVPYAVAAHLALRQMPEVRIRPSLFCWTVLRDTSRFSVYAYLNTLAQVLRQKADQPIISSLLGVTAVTPYLGGAKVGEMFGMLARQIADVLSPTAAHLHASGDGEALRRTLLEGLRFSTLAATPLFLVVAATMDGAIHLLTGNARPTAEMYWSGQLLLAWYYSLTLTHWVFKRMYMMAGQERRMMWQGLLEALANIVAGIAFTLATGSVIGVALGALIPGLLFGWGQLWGWAAREAALSRLALFRRVVAPAWWACLPAAVIALALQIQPWWNRTGSIPVFLAEATTVGLVAIAGTWAVGLSPAERQSLRRRLAPQRRT